MIVAVLFACGGAAADTRSLVVGGETVVVEIADDPVERNRGLMYRDALGADRGMLFVYPDEQNRSFWMKDTKIPLTIAYLDAKGVIVHLADMRPLDTSSVPSGKPAMYALEMTQGWFAEHGVRVGDVVGGLPAPSAR